MTKQIVIQKEVSTQAQTERLLKCLEEGRTINPLEAWMRLGIYRLSARIFDLRQRGISVSGEIVPVLNQYGEKCRVKQYQIDGGASA